VFPVEREQTRQSVTLHGCDEPSVVRRETFDTSSPHQIEPSCHEIVLIDKEREPPSKELDPVNSLVRRHAKSILSRGIRSGPTCSDCPKLVKILRDDVESLAT
jgi:hypothetical protein